MTAQNTTLSPRRIIAAACVGNALEWYDIAIYSYFATYISAAFFATDDPAFSLILALGTFAVSFLIRPVGAIVLGGYADRVGRRPALTASILLMALGTLLICVMPTAASIGPLAGIGILVARLIQGFAAGGEFGSATALMVEHLPHRRGFAASWQFTSQAMSTLLAASVGTVLTHVMSTEDLHAWGFRIPFVVGLLVAPVGLYIRNRVPEPDEAVEVRERGATVTPVRTVLRDSLPMVALTVGVLAVTTCLTYFIAYIPTYATTTLGMPDSRGFIATLAAGIVLLVGTPIAGHLCDRLGRISLMLPAAIATGVLVYPLFAIVTGSGSFTVLLVIAMALAALKSVYYGPMASLMAQLFPTQTRATGMALGYNIGVAAFGGTTPLVATWLIGATGQDTAPAYWVALTAVISITALVILRRRYQHR